MTVFVDSFNQIFSSLGGLATNSLVAIPELLRGFLSTASSSLTGSLAQTSLMPFTTSASSLGSIGSIVPAPAPAAGGMGLADILFFPIPQIMSLLG